MNRDSLRSHYQLMAFRYLESNFDKERVDQLRAYLKSELSISARSHKRYITIPFKRPRTEDLSVQYEEETKMQDKPYDDSFHMTTKPGSTVENVMPSNLIMVGATQPTESRMVMSVHSPNDIPML